MIEVSLVFHFFAYYYSFCAERLNFMLQTLQLLELGDYSAVVKVANFATLVSTYLEGTYNYESQRSIN